MRKDSVFLLIFILTFIIPRSISAEENTTGNLFSVSLAELMELEVVTVSKKKEQLSTTPGIISIITSEDIKKFGAQTVAEAIGFSPGIMCYDTYVTWYNQFTIRGNYAFDHFNTKILFMVNGHPVYMAVDGGFEVNSIPVEAIDRIEIIRGPVSVFYGTNALTGVINIITKKEIPDALTEISYQYGSFNTNEVRASIGQTIDDFRYFVSGTIKDQRGYDLSVDPDQTENSDAIDHKQSNEYNTAFLNMQYKDFDLDIGYSDIFPTTKIGQTPSSLLPIDYIENKYRFLDLRYKNQISGFIDINCIIRYDESSLRWDAAGLYLIEYLYYSLPLYPRTVKCDFGNKKLGTEFYANIYLMDKLDITAGILYDKYYDAYYFAPNDSTASGSSPVSPWMGDRDNNDTAAYLNFNYRVFKILSLVGGSRFTENDISGEHWDYRGGIVVPLKESLVIKALYGTSYRSPSIYEIFTDAAPIVSGNENLKFETLDGADFSVYYAFEKKFVGMLTYYWNRTEDFISRTITSFGPQYSNFEGEENQGIEYEFNFYLLKDLAIFLNGAYIFEHKNLETNEELQVVENIANLGFSVKFLKNALTVSNSNRYCSDWGKSDSFIVSNLAINYKPIFLDNMELYLAANNLFDKKYTYAEINRRNVDTIPGGGPRSICIRASIKY